MPADWGAWGAAYLPALAMMALFAILFFVAKVFHDLATRYHVDEELCGKDNLAVAVTLAGYLLGVTVVFLGALLGPSHGFREDLVAVGGYSLLGIALLNFSHLVNDRVILYRFRNLKELVEDRNVGTGAVQFGSYIASALVVAAAIHGQGGSWLTALAFFGLGQLALILFAWLYNRITPFSVHDEIEADNVAAGVGFGGTLIALGLILAAGTRGDFVGWSENIIRFGVTALIGMVLLVVVRLLLDRVILRGGELNHEIAQDRNIGAGLIEMTVAVSIAAVFLALA